MSQSTFWQTFLRIQETVQLAEDQRLSLAGSGATSYLVQEAVTLSDGVPFNTFDTQNYSSAEGASRGLASAFLSSFGGEPRRASSRLREGIPSGGGVPPTAPTQVLPLVYQYMAVPQQATAFANPFTDGAIACSQAGPLVNSRNLTRGSPSYGAANVGTGVLYRLNVDAYGFPLEGGFAQTLNAQCTADAQSGTITGQEQFTVLGQPFRDALTWFAAGYGSGLVATGSNGFVGVTADTTQALVQNSSFSQGTGVNFTSWVVTGWTQTVGLATALGIDTTNYYRASAIEGTTPASLIFQSTATITQPISANAGSLAITAYLNQLAWNDTIGGGSGVITVAIGSKSWSVASGAGGWQTLRPAIDKALWFQNFNQANLAVTIGVTVTGGTRRIDDFCWAPLQALDSALYWLVGGATAFLVNDTIKVIDTEPNPPKKVQNQIRLNFPGYFFPSAVLPTAPVAGPTVALSGTAGVVTAGAHVFYVTFVTAVAESGLGPASAVVVADGAHKIDLSVIPTGPGGTLGRGIYCTHAGGTIPSAQPYLVAYLADNVDRSGRERRRRGALEAAAEHGRPGELRCPPRTPSARSPRPGASSSGPQWGHGRGRLPVGQHAARGPRDEVCARPHEQDLRRQQRGAGGRRRGALPGASARPSSAC